MTTDFLKDDEQLFYKYMAEIGADLEKFNSEKLESYLDKTKNIPYENESKLSVDVNVPKELMSELDDDYWDIVNGLNITFKGKVDNKNKKAEQDININYSDTVSFPIKYRRNQDLYAVTSSLVLKTYIGVKNENLDKLYENIQANEGIGSFDIPNKINTDALQLNQENVKSLLNNIQRVFMENLNKTNFSKLDNNAIVLILNEQETVTLMTKILEEMKNSGIINQEQIAQIDEVIGNAKNANATTNEFLKLIVKKDGSIEVLISGEQAFNIQVNSEEIRLSSQNNVNISIKKIEDVNSIAYIADCSSLNDISNFKVNFDVKYSNIDSNSVEENYRFGILLGDEGEKLEYKYSFDTKKNFSEIINIEPLKESDAFILNTADKNYANTVLTAVGEVLTAVNASQMSKLGLEPEQNPLIFATPIGYTIYLFNQTINNSLDNMINTEVAAFNAKFDVYQGNQVRNECTGSNSRSYCK